jgi:menaquinone-specific isochorismate synthase
VVLAGARSLLEGCRRGSDDAIASIPRRGARLFGGFAFRDEHEPRGVWTGFPGALFQLPRVELESDGQGRARLTVRGTVPAEGDTGSERDAVEEACRRMARRLASAHESSNEPRPGLTARRGETDRASWERAVEETLDAVTEGRIAKAVLARTLDVTPSGNVDPVDVALALWAQNRGAHAFLFEPEPGRPLVGAAPEAVAVLRGSSFHATAVAGSIRSGETSRESRELGLRLLASAKDRAEQRVVVEDMVRRLEPFARDIDVQEEPHVLTFARIQHLETEIRASVPDHHVLEVVEALHPTPAVCGVPRDEALTFLSEEEPFDRGWYAGPVGWFDEAGEGVFVPALRTAVVSEGRWRLFAGAGIVAGSDPASEWEETGMKFEPVLRALASAGVET